MSAATEAEVDAFKRAWEEQDARQRVGTRRPHDVLVPGPRTRAGLAAALAVHDARRNPRPEGELTMTTTPPSNGTADALTGWMPPTPLTDQLMAGTLHLTPAADPALDALDALDRVELDAHYANRDDSAARVASEADTATIRAALNRTFAETGVEWGYAHPDALDDAYGAWAREDAEAAVKYRRMTTGVRYALVHRTAAGPWEVAE